MVIYTELDFTFSHKAAGKRITVLNLCSRSPNICFSSKILLICSKTVRSAIIRCKYCISSKLRFRTQKRTQEVLRTTVYLNFLVGHFHVADHASILPALTASSPYTLHAPTQSVLSVYEESLSDFLSDKVSCQF